MRIRLAATLLFGLPALAGCATAPQWTPRQRFSPTSDLASARTVGPGRRFRPFPTAVAVAHGAAVDAMTCTHGLAAVSAVHVELFADNHVVVIPAGIGLAPPLERRGAYVPGGRCAYPMHTVEPTGLVLLGGGSPRKLGEFFDLWGQPLDAQRAAGFHAAAGRRVLVFIDGRRWSGDPRSVSLTPETQVTVEVGPPVPPHAHYAFPSLESLAPTR